MNLVEKIVSPSVRAKTSASTTYKPGGNEVPVGNDVDHVHDLQLGGSEAISNMAILDRSVNRRNDLSREEKMKEAIVLTTVTALVAGAFFVYCSPLLVKLEKDGFAGGTLDIAGTKLDEAPGSGTKYHLVFVNEESSASVSCGKDGKVASRDGYLSPWLEWYVSFRLSDCSISGFKPIF